MTEQEIIAAIQNEPNLTFDEINALPAELRGLLSKKWDDMTDREKEYFLTAWETKPGTINHAAQIAGTPDERRAAANYLREMRAVFIRETGRESSGKEFDATTAGELLEMIERAAK